METANESLTTKQYKNKQIQLVLQDSSKCEIRTDANLFSACAAGPSQANTSQNYDHDDIDLNLLNTQVDDCFLKKGLYNLDQDRMMNISRINSNRLKHEIETTEKSYHSVSPPRRKRRRRNILNNVVINYGEVQDMQACNKAIDIPYEVLGEIYDKAPSPEALQNSIDARVEEVMKAAKSLFSKRTRTLYHWMHPNAPKQQIKAAVSASWESLGTQEKQFYTSQVLGRFGFPQCNLMINPQLGGIKQLPLLPNITDLNDISTNELQNAISSITSDGNVFFSPESQFQNNYRQIVRRKRLGRPPGSKNKKSLMAETPRGPINHDFQDDPELSEELEQFAMNLNLPSDIQ